MNEYLFAYGTLADGTAPKEIAAMMKGLKFAGEGFVFGRLYDIGEYPGAVLTGRGPEKVFGKIFQLDTDGALLKRLDAYEGFVPERPSASLFVRKRTAINRAKGSPVTGWVYEYNGEVKRPSRIKSGRYSKVPV